MKFGGHKHKTNNIEGCGIHGPLVTLVPLPVSYVAMHITLLSVVIIKRFEYIS